jgi:acyl-coenzyme A thioesterase PaaI-like protein
VNESVNRQLETIHARIGIGGTVADDRLQSVHLDPYPQLCANGVVRISVWVLMADIIGGWQAERSAGTDWTFTTDLSVRAPVLRVPERVVGTSTTLRAGKGNVAAEAFMHDETGALFAYSHVGFIRMPRRASDPPKPDMASSARNWGERELLTSLLAEAAGAEIVDPVIGHIEVALEDRLRNPAGAMQGAMVALVGELAAEELAAHHLGGPFVVTEIDVRYLAMGRIGPVYSRADFVGPPSGRTVRVELRDRGNDDRLISAILARVERAPLA